ncbi:SRPBCC domain-containing protein [Streptomyces sp. NPDC059224]|uniref:SRPBCC domain-containing protein n=1 Tax=Streptomyces sp. NPDC059224 TaxID=3346775 RepID=UPI0036807234
MAVLQLVIRLPRPMGQVWPSLSTPEGLAAWLTPVDVLQPRLGGTVTLGGLGTGRVTAWDVDRIAEYTVAGGGRIRFHLEHDGESGTVLRFTHESEDATATEQQWPSRFERLTELLAV